MNAQRRISLKNDRVDNDDFFRGQILNGQLRSTKGKKRGKKYRRDLIYRPRKMSE